MERVLNSRPLSEPPPTAATARPGRASAPGTPHPIAAPPRSAVPYAELHAHSAFSFLDGASTPEELVEEAARLGLRAIALTDHDGLYGVVRFAEAARELGMRTVFGAELSLGEYVAAHRGPRPARPASAGPGPRPGGLPAAVSSVGRRAPGRRREGQAAL